MRKIVGICLILACLIMLSGCYGGYFNNELTFFSDNIKIHSSQGFSGGGDNIYYKSRQTHKDPSQQRITRKSGNIKAVINAKVYNYKPVSLLVGYESMGSDSEKKCYEMIKDNAYMISDTVGASGLYPINEIKIENVHMDSSMIKKVLKAVQYDNPVIFWIASTVSFSNQGNSTVIKLNSMLSPEECRRSIEKLSDVMCDAFNGIPKNFSEYDRELYIHDFIIDHCKYDKASENHDSWRKYTVLGVLIDGKAVCEGYSKAMQLMLCAAGVECRTINGSKGDELHMWNIVNINSDWYHVDTTWDSADNLRRYSYFNLTDSIIKINHTIDRQIDGKSPPPVDCKYNFILPPCTSQRENYFFKNAVRIDRIDEKADEKIISKLRELVSKKEQYIHIMFSPRMEFDSSVHKLLSEHPYKFFGYIDYINNEDLKNKIDKKRVYFADNKAMGVITIQISYI